MNIKILFLFVALFCIIQFTQADFMEDVKDVWKSSVKGVQKTFSSIGDWFGDKASDAKDATSDLYDDAKSGMKDISKKIS
ncbi:CLUMA_CG010920, isoform A [Clunio marinus]|uniref:CLUMA_CG010920, isoform A n=1 Tax=Clunio marinus TaxID=568069 RepID=A0A1J1ID97_9DIPT|nr:CLUMA_CG010920, isoform A [Clunio marinus]